MPLNFLNKAFDLVFKNAEKAVEAFGYLALTLFALLILKFGVEVVSGVLNVGVDFLVRLASFL